MSKLSKTAEHKWMTYFIWTVIIAIFGMVIYMVTVDEKKEDRYYASVIFHSANSAPLYPPDTGTLEGGIKKVRDAVANLVSETSDVNFKVPSHRDWHLNAVPILDNDTSGLNGGFHYFYTFPLSHTDFGDAGKLADDFADGAFTVNNLFSYNADDLTWATNSFTDGPVSVNLTYGTRDSVTAANVV